MLDRFNLESLKDHDGVDIGEDMNITVHPACGQTSLPAQLSLFAWKVGAEVGANDDAYQRPARF